MASARAAQLARQLVALRQAGGAERVALGQQAAGRIGDELAAIGVVAVVDEAFRAAFGAEAERLVGDQLVVREAVVQLDDVDILGPDAGGLIDLVGRGSRHVEADHLHHVAGVEGRGGVGGHRLRGDPDVLAQAVLAGELLRHQHGRRGAAGRRAGHQARHHAGPDHLIVHDVVGGDFLAEQRQRIVPGVPARLGADFGERRQRRAVFLHVAEAGAAEIAQRQRHAGGIDQLVGGRVELVERAGPVGEDGAERAGLHLLEAERQHAVERAGLDRLPRQEQRGRAGRAIVVDVDDRDAGHADLVERALAAGGVAVDIADIGLLDHVVADAGIREREPGRFRAHHRVGRVGARLDEGDHADAGNIDARCHGALP